MARPILEDDMDRGLTTSTHVPRGWGEVLVSRSSFGNWLRWIVLSESERSDVAGRTQDMDVRLKTGRAQDRVQCGSSALPLPPLSAVATGSRGTALGNLPISLGNDPSTRPDSFTRSPICAFNVERIWGPSDSPLDRP